MTAKTFKKAFFIFLPLLVFFSFFIFFTENFPNTVFSNDIQKKESELEEKKKEKEEALSQLEKVKKEIARVQNSGYSLDQQIRLIEAELKRVEDETKKVLDDIKVREKSILTKEADLAEKKEQVESISERLYKNSRFSFLEILFRQGGDDNLIKTLIFNRFVISSQISYMRSVADEMKVLNAEKKELEKQKENFEKDQKEFAESKSLLAEQKVKMQQELNRQVASRSNLTTRIGGLERQISELQNFLLLMKSGGTVVNAEKIISTKDRGVIGNAPTGSFGVFSFGAHTHRNGMSQWGARARADAGQNYESILKFYYPKLKLDKSFQEPETIRILGSGTSCTRQPDGTYNKYYNETISFDAYLNRIYEMPASWNSEVLKAQAIAARTFAIYKVNTQGYIVPNQSNQVSKDCDNSSRWVEAVQSTKNHVLTSGNSAALVQYAAVHGGWVNNVGYDVRSTSGSWIEESWDNLSGVSWFYRNWYDRDGQGTVCSTHPNPWLTNAEMADIVNAYLYWSHSSVKSDPRLTAVDIAICWGKKDANPYSIEELKGKLRELGIKPVNSISNIIVSNSNGWSAPIVFVTDVGNITIPKDANYNSSLIFRDVYNMRAPAFFAIPQKPDANPGFLHINIEIK